MPEHRTRAAVLSPVPGGNQNLVFVPNMRIDIAKGTPG
jgi:hypothetical protein